MLLCPKAPFNRKSLQQRAAKSIHSEGRYSACKYNVARLGIMSDTSECVITACRLTCGSNEEELASCPIPRITPTWKSRVAYQQSAERGLMGVTYVFVPPCPRRTTRTESIGTALPRFHEQLHVLRLQDTFISRGS